MCANRVDFLPGLVGAVSNMFGKVMGTGKRLSTDPCYIEVVMLLRFMAIKFGSSQDYNNSIESNSGVESSTFLEEML